MPPETAYVASEYMQGRATNPVDDPGQTVARTLERLEKNLAENSAMLAQGLLQELGVSERPEAGVIGSAMKDPQPPDAADRLIRTAERLESEVLAQRTKIQAAIEVARKLGAR